MSKRLLINDSWVLERAGYFSNSFSGFISNLTGGLKLSKQIQKGLSFTSKLATPEGQKEMGIPEFVSPLVSKIMSTLGKDLPDKIQGEFDRAMKKAELETQQALQEAEQTRQKALEDAMKVKDENLADLDEKLVEMDEKLKTMDQTIGQQVASRLFQTDINSLAKALYDVAKERGVTNEGVLYLIRMLPEFEALMYFMNVRKFYRDHTAHSLRVATLGDFFLEKEGSAGVLDGVIADKLNFTKNEARTAWWFAGLLHDIGTPLSKLFTSLNWSLVNEMLKAYPSLGMEITPMRINIQGDSLGNLDYVPILCKEMPKSWQTLIKEGIGKFEKSYPPIIYEGGQKEHIPYNPKSSAMDHGVVAALTLLRTLGPPEHLEKELPEDRPLIEAARAIALHNFTHDIKQIPFEKYPLLFLLVLTDELQEWGRPIPVTMKDGYFTTTLQKITMLDAIFYEAANELWDIPYGNPQAKKIARFDFKRLYNDKEKALAGMNCTEQFPDSDLLLINYEKDKEKTAEKFTIEIRTL